MRVLRLDVEACEDCLDCRRYIFVAARRRLRAVNVDVDICIYVYIVCIGYFRRVRLFVRDINDVADIVEMREYIFEIAELFRPGLGSDVLIVIFGFECCFDFVCGVCNVCGAV